MFGNVFNAVRMAVAYGFAVVNCKFTMLTIDVKDLLSNKGAAADGGALAVLEEQVEQYGGGAFSIVQTGVIYIVGIGLLAGGGLMALHANNASKREDDKTALYWRLGSGVLVFAAVPILLFAQKIGEALFGM